MMDMGSAIMEFASELVPLDRGAPRRAAGRSRFDLGERRARRLSGGAVGDGPGDGPVHLRWRGDDSHGHRARAGRAHATSRAVGRDGGRPDPDPRRGRGAHPLGDPAQQLLPHRDPGFDDRRSTAVRGRRSRDPAAIRRRTATRRCSTIPTRSTSAATRTRTSRSGSARTSASGLRWRVSSYECCSRSSRAGSRIFGC